MKIIADMHTHTIASGHAYSTLNELAAEAARKGLLALAVTDHGPALPGGPHIYHFGAMRFFPEHISGVRIFRGIEANILVINGYLAARAEEITGVISGVAADPSLVKPEAFSWENKSISRPTKLLTRETARSWGGPIFEILVVVVLAFVTLGGACWICFQHDTARTFLTIGLLVLDVAEAVALVAWGRWSHGNWAGKTDSAGNKTS